MQTAFEDLLLAALVESELRHAKHWHNISVFGTDLVARVADVPTYDGARVVCHLTLVNPSSPLPEFHLEYRDLTVMWEVRADPQTGRIYPSSLSWRIAELQDNSNDIACAPVLKIADFATA